ncbi:MAG: hypothetical protein AAFY11_06000 [Cyanobacteria bacterium J06641_5]
MISRKQSGWRQWCRLRVLIVSSIKVTRSPRALHGTVNRSIAPSNLSEFDAIAAGTNEASAIEARA